MLSNNPNTTAITREQPSLNRSAGSISGMILDLARSGLRSFLDKHPTLKTALIIAAGTNFSHANDNPVQAHPWLASVTYLSQSTSFKSHHTVPSIGSSIQVSTDLQTWTSVGRLVNSQVTDTNAGDSYTLTGSSVANVTRTFWGTHFTDQNGAAQNFNFPVTAAGTEYSGNVAHTAAPGSKLFVRIVPDNDGSTSFFSPLGKVDPIKNGLSSLVCVQNVGFSYVIKHFHAQNPGAPIKLQTSRDLVNWSHIANIDQNGVSDIFASDTFTVTGNNSPATIKEFNVVTIYNGITGQFVPTNFTTHQRGVESTITVLDTSGGNKIFFRAVGDTPSYTFTATSR